MITLAMIKKLQELAAEYGQAYDRGEFDEIKRERVSSGELENRPQIRSKIVGINVKASGGKEYEIVSRVKHEYRELWVNDISLQFGGRYDYKIAFHPPHSTHMFGEQADINHLGDPIKMNSKQITWFKNNAPKYFESVEIHNGNHFHCSKPRS